jgi:hypothetical protein
MQDKDIFEKFYSKMLAKRLINQMSASNDYEKLMISNIQVSYYFLRENDRYSHDYTQFIVLIPNIRLPESNFLRI